MTTVSTAAQRRARVLTLQARRGAPPFENIRAWLQGRYGVSAFGRLPEETQDRAIDEFERHFFAKAPQTMSTPTVTKDGPNYYSRLAIQPRELAMKNRWDADAFSILKYVTRYREKDGLKDLDKGIHFARMRAEFRPLPLSATPVVGFRDYVTENGMLDDQSLCDAISALWDCVYDYRGPTGLTDRLIERIEALKTNFIAASAA